jgi:hypothetical protein
VCARALSPARRARLSLTRAWGHTVALPAAKVMADALPVLHVGDKNLSSWSLRPWLALKVARVPFAEAVHRLDRPTTHAALAAVSPTARVPALHVPARFFAGSTTAPHPQRTRHADHGTGTEPPSHTHTHTWTDTRGRTGRGGSGGGVGLACDH